MTTKTDDKVEKQDKKTPKKVGRKRIDIDYAEVERLAARGLGSTQIARALGVSWSTIDRNRKRSAEFDDIIKRGKVRGIAMVTDALLESATGGNVTAQIFYLKNRDGERWQDRTNIAHEHKVSIRDAMDAARARPVPNRYPETKIIEGKAAETADIGGSDDDGALSE